VNGDFFERYTPAVRIAIDATPAMKERRTGVARYVENLVQALAAVAPEEDFVLCNRLSRISRRRHRLPIPGPRFRERWVQGPVGPRGMDVAHGTAARVLRLPGARPVVTVHDVFSLDTKDFANEKFRRRREKSYREAAEHASRIICVSEWTRARFLAHHPDAADRTVTIPHGVEDRFEPAAAERLTEVRSRHGIDGPYLVFVGEISARKNMRRLLDAFAGLPKDSPRLVLAGSPARGYEDIAAEVAAGKLAGRVIVTGYFPDEDLPTLLAGAECLVFPSLMEGFGLPAVEAMACGTPVVASDRGALPEVTGGACVTVDPESPESIREGIVNVLDDEDLRARLIEKGIARARALDWKRVGRRTLAVYRGVCEASK